MTNNDILRSLRFALDLTDAKVSEIFLLGGRELTPQQVKARMGREGEPGTVLLRDNALSRFLDGLIIDRRGPRPPSKGPPPPRPPLSNNEVLKKLRIALQLRDDEMLALLAAGGQHMSKPELTAIFRKPDHRSYRECGDQALRKFLAGLKKERRGGGVAPKSE